MNAHRTRLAVVAGAASIVVAYAQTSDRPVPPSRAGVVDRSSRLSWTLARTEAPLPASGDATVMLAGVNISRVLKTTNLSDAESVSITVFDFEQLERMGGSGDASELLLDQEVQRLAARQSRDGKRVFVEFRPLKSAGEVYLAVNRYVERVEGWGLLEGRRVEVRPIPKEERSKPHVSEHVVVYFRHSAAEARRPVQDYGVKGTVADATSALPTRSPAARDLTDPKDCSRSDDNIIAPKPLTMLVGFTPLADTKSRAAETGIVNQAELSASALERAFNRSGINANVEVTGVVPVNFQQAPDVYGVLQQLAAATDPALRDFHRRRKQQSADILVLVMHQDDNTQCGWARNIRVGAKDAFLVVNWQCMSSKLSLPHEIGHLIGAMHDDESTPPAYARGLLHDDGASPFVTIMSYEEHCLKTRRCVRIPYFSDPATRYDGVVVGKAGKADNACVIRSRLPEVLEFGEQL